MTTIKLVAIQPSGRQMKFARAFGYRTEDPRKRLVEVAIPLGDAVGIRMDADVGQEFGEIEVPDNGWTWPVYVGEVKVVNYPGGAA